MIDLLIGLGLTVLLLRLVERLSESRVVTASSKRDRSAP